VGAGRFKDLSASAGPGVRDAQSSRGSAAGDLDNDGSLEVVIANMGTLPTLLKNFAAKKNWLLVQCIGTTANRDAIGARVTVSVGGRKVSGEVQGGAGYISQNDARLHFGLRDNATYDGIEVHWPGGATEVFAGGKANQIVKLTQGAGTPTQRRGAAGR
jgi:hypothetical protein